MQGEEYWLSQALAKQANQQANERVENDPWVEIVQGLPSDITEEHSEANLPNAISRYKRKPNHHSDD